AVLAIGSVPNSAELDVQAAGIELDAGGYIPINHHCQSNVPHVYAAGDVSGKLPLSSVAAMQGRKIAEHVMGLHTREFVKIVSDPATGVVLGGSIVGRHAAELISVIALAVTAGLRVTDIVESLFAHPSLAEALAEAAD